MVTIKLTDEQFSIAAQGGCPDDIGIRYTQCKSIYFINPDECKTCWKEAIKHNNAEVTKTQSEG